nr:CHAT domain-containing tetratricopeptide repeat protein [Synechococcus sp. CCAP 1479/9]
MGDRLYAEARELYERQLSPVDQSLADFIISQAKLFDSKILIHLGSTCEIRGDYVSAEACYKRALEITEGIQEELRLVNATHLDHTAKILDLIANLYIITSEKEESDSFHPHFTVIEKQPARQQKIGADGQERPAWIHDTRAAYSKAQPLLERSLLIRMKLLGIDDLNTMQSRSRLAWLYLRQGLYTKAEAILEQSLQIAEHSLGADDLETASILAGLSEIHFNGLQYSKAVPYGERALRMRESRLGLDHLDTIASLNNLGSLYAEIGQFSKAEAAFLRLLNASETVHGKDDPIAAVALTNIGWFYIGYGSYTKAEAHLNRALAIRTKSLGHGHLDTADTIDKLGTLFSQQGRFSEAKDHYETALTIRLNALGDNHSLISGSLANLASVYWSQGDYYLAERMYIHALESIENELGPNHLSTAIFLHNLASFWSSFGGYAKAETLLLRSLSIRKEELGAEHPTTARTLLTLASVFLKRNDYRQAQLHLEVALEITEKALGPVHPDTAWALEIQAEVYQRQGDFSNALPLYDRALSIKKEAFGVDHLSTARTFFSIAELYLVQYCDSNAELMLRNGIDSQVLFLLRELPLLPLSMRQEQVAALGNIWRMAFAIADRTYSTASLALYARLNRHGLLQEIQRRQFSLKMAKSTHRVVIDRIAELNVRLTAVTVTAGQRRTLLSERAELERQLYRALPKLEPRLVQTSEVAANLPNDGILVEFQRFSPLDDDYCHELRWGKSRYLALLLRPDGSTLAVPLGEESIIETLVENALEASEQALGDALDSWALVVDLVITPLLPYISGFRQWFLCPDGELHRIPFAALPAPQASDRCLSEVVELRLLTTGRDLLRLQQENQPCFSPLVVADPAYDLNYLTTDIDSTNSLSSDYESRGRSVDMPRVYWEPLPYTATEGRRVADLLNTIPLMQAEATVCRIQSAPAPKILHIATHGFFLPDQVQADPHRQVIDPAHPLTAMLGEDPLLRSGLVLAGANQPQANLTDDGYLTAAEVCELQLQGTELAVMSACSTGRGDIQTGEGVYGLQRAFTVAGARSTLLSLWKVDDEATAAFMEIFYRQLLNGVSRSHALVTAQTQFRSHPNIAWRHPYYWAAWQLVGDWGPIQGL